MTERLQPGPLPKKAQEACIAARAPARLVAHLRLVHDVARQLTAALQQRWPELSMQADEVLVGAATHDIGKALAPQELSGPGNTHEPKGQALLLSLGFSPSEARFAVTHGDQDWDALALEDLWVQLADTCWKGKRRRALEERIARMTAARLEEDFFTCLLWYEDFLEQVSAQAEQRLMWQGSFSCDGEPQEAL